VKMLLGEEARIDGPYMDSEENLTAGVGHLLTGTELGEVTVILPTTHSKYKSGGNPLSDLTSAEKEQIGKATITQLSNGDVRQGGFTFRAPTFDNTRIDGWLASDSSAALDRARNLSQELRSVYEDAGDDDFLLRLTSMYFQMPDWERKFPMASKALRRGDKEEAANQLLVDKAGTGDSLWLGQTPKRAKAAAKAFRGLTSTAYDYATDYEWDMYGESGLGGQQTAEAINGLATDLMEKQTQVAARNGLSPDARMMGDVLRYG
jgi:hypothetical protein